MAAGGDLGFVLFSTSRPQKYLKITWEALKWPREQIFHAVKHRKDGIT